MVKVLRRIRLELSERRHFRPVDGVLAYYSISDTSIHSRILISPKQRNISPFCIGIRPCLEKIAPKKKKMAQALDVT